jgi:hypothetical protein
VTGSGRPDASTATTPRHRLRRALATALVVVGAIVGPVAVTGLWARALVDNTDTYVDAVAPLATDATITAALEDRVTDAVMNGVDSLDVGGQIHGFLTGRGIPDRLATLLTSALSGLGSNLRDLISRTVASVIEDPRFASTWTTLNRTTHRALVAVVDGDSRLLDGEGNLALSLQPVIVAVQQRLVSNGQSWASLLPSNTTAAWVLVPAEQVDNLRDAVNTLRTVAIALAIVELVVIAGAILLAPDRMRGLAWLAFGVAVGSVAALGALRYAQHALLGNYPQLSHPEAVMALIQAVTGTLVDWLRLMFVAGLAVAAAAALLGRGSRARRARARLAGFRARMTRPPYSGPRRAIATVVAIGCGLALMVADDLSAFAVGALLFGVLIGAVLALIPGVQGSPGAAAEPSVPASPAPVPPAAEATAGQTR